MRSATSLLVLAFLLTSCRTTEDPATQLEPASATTVDVDRATQKDLGIRVAPASASILAAPVLATGQIQLNEDRTWNVGSLSKGRLVSIPVHLGDTVRAGQALAYMHSSEVNDARANRQQAIGELTRLKVLAEHARKVRDRTRRLLDLKAASQEQMEAVETELRSMQLSIANAEAEVERTETYLREYLDVPLIDKANGVSQIDQNHVPIKSPAAGVVMDRLASVGTVVSPGTPVITVSDLASLWLIAAVNEADLQHVRRGQTAEISVRAYPNRKFSGTIFQLGERLDPQTRTLQVRLLVRNLEGLLKPDMFATVLFAPEEQREVIHVPESAIQEIHGKTIVFIRRPDESFSSLEITVGRRVNDQVEVLSGLQIGTPIVVDGALLLKSHLVRTEAE